MGFIFFLFVFFVGGRWLIGKLVGNVIFPKSDDDCVSNYKSQDTFIDNSVHNHFHVHTNKKSKEIEKIGRYADSLEDNTIDVDYKDV